MFTEPHCTVSLVQRINLLFCESHAVAVGPFFFAGVTKNAGWFPVVLGRLASIASNFDTSNFLTRRIIRVEEQRRI